MKTTFSRIFITTAMILLVALILVGAGFQLLVKHYLTNKEIDHLKNNGVTISRVATAYYVDNSISNDAFLLNLSVAATVSDADAIICDTAGRLLLCSDAPLGCNHQGLAITDKRFLSKALSQDHVVTNGRIEGLYSDNRYIVSTPIRDTRSGMPVGIVIVSSPVDATLSVAQRLSDTYLSISLLVVLVAVVIITFYTRKNSNPLQDMASTATAFGHGNLQARVQITPDSPQEIRELALAFNNMANSLEQSEYQRKEFVANVSHELKTPMTTIGGYVDGILDGTIPQEKQSHYLKIVSDETKRLSRLVRSMLDISKLQEQGHIPDEKKTRFDVEECVGRVLISFEDRITTKNLNVAVDMPEHPLYTFACQDYITQVLYNLLDNSIKFCPEGGFLKLTLREGPNKLYISISNTGTPIPAQELPLLFERFHKLDKSRSENRDGWGLGLYIVKTLICSHGEDISVTSSEEKTEFTFTLPLAN